MVLPSDRHTALRRWLAARGVDANELAGILVTGDLDALLVLAGSHQRLGPHDRHAVAEARAIVQDNPVWPELGDIGTAACELRVSAVLERVCEALRHEGVPAAPYEGLGVTWGHELLEARVVLDDLDPLYERMHRDAATGTA